MVKIDHIEKKLRGGSVVQKHTQQCAVHPQLAVVCGAIAQSKSCSGSVWWPSGVISTAG